MREKVVNSYLGYHIRNRGYFLGSFRSQGVAPRSHQSRYIQFSGGKMYPKMLHYDHI